MLSEFFTDRKRVSPAKSRKSFLKSRILTMVFGLEILIVLSVLVFLKVKKNISLQTFCSLSKFKGMSRYNVRTRLPSKDAQKK